MASVLLHMAVTAFVSHKAPRAFTLIPSPPSLGRVRTVAGTHEGAENTDSREVAIDLSPVDSEGATPPAPAPNLVARLDTGDPGRGGEARSSDPAVNLADQDEHTRLSPDLLDRKEHDQVQRIRVARARTSWEDRRSTTHPDELTLVTTGSGSIRERRPDAPALPSRGSLDSMVASVRGASPTGALGPSDEDETGHGDSSAGGPFGAREAAPGAGSRDAAPLVRHRPTVPRGQARPDVTNGPVTIPARQRAPVRDDIDSEQEVATTVRSLVQASAAGGLAGQGQGGSEGGGLSGAGGAAGAGATSRARPFSSGTGDAYDYFTDDSGLLPYFRQVHARIDPLWANAFPKSALMDLKQGTVILDFTIFADGRVTVAWPPVRPSGIDEFDRNCADAIRRAAPLPPIPRDLGVTQLRIRAPFVADNPIIK